MIPEVEDVRSVGDLECLFAGATAILFADHWFSTELASGMWIRLGGGGEYC